MQQILVTTDLSDNSKAGIYFAIRMAKQIGARLIFVHVYQVLRATVWSDDQYQHFIDRNRDVLSEDLTSFIDAAYEAQGEQPTDYQTVVHHNMDVVGGILKSAEKYQCQYICISTRGAGMLKKFVGTNTGKLIVNATIPILCIPSAWQPTAISRILYASDMQQPEEELRLIADFARPLNAVIDMLHLYLHPDLAGEKEGVEKRIAIATNYPIELHYEQRNIDRPIVAEMDAAVAKYKPDLLVMFTNQNRTFFERLFLSSNTEAYSFRTEIPMLTINK